MYESSRLGNVTILQVGEGSYRMVEYTYWQMVRGSQHRLYPFERYLGLYAPSSFYFVGFQCSVLLECLKVSNRALRVSSRVWYYRKPRLGFLLVSMRNPVYHACGIYPPFLLPYWRMNVTWKDIHATSSPSILSTVSASPNVHVVAVVLRIWCHLIALNSASERHWLWDMR